MQILSTFKTGSEVEIEKNVKNHSREIYDYYSKPFIIDFLTGKMEEGIYLSKHNKNIVIDTTGQYKEDDNSDPIIHHPDKSLSTIFKRPYVLAKGQVQIHFCYTSKDLFKGMAVLEKIFKEMGSSLIRKGNDFIYEDDTKAIGALNINFGEKNMEVIAVNFDIDKHLEEFIPEEVRHRGFANIDIDINKLILKFLDECEKISSNS